VARGTIIQRPSKDGKRTSYRVRWETRGPNGKRKHHSATCRTKKEAEALLTEKQRTVNDGTYVDASKETLGAYMERWLDAMAPTWAESTLAGRTSIVRQRIVPELGLVPLAQLDAITVQTFYAGLTKRYAPGTVRLTHSVLNSALTRAVTWRLILRNPTDDAILPSLPRQSAVVWTTEECAQFLTAVHDHRFAPLWRLALDSGMRIGEILGLGWRDVALDRDEPSVSVRRTVTRDKNWKHKLGDVPKTHASNRAILIGEDTVTALRSYRALQAQRRLLLGPQWHDLGLVFDRGDGGLLRNTTVAEALERVLDKHPTLPRITLHGMRHTMATLALEGGINPKVVQERLGHASIQMTLDRYSHVTQSMQAEAADVINTLLRGEARPKRGQSAG
jgi:integrase